MQSHTLLIVHEVAALRQALSQQSAKRVALVPTMGNLHAGHLALVALAKQHAQVVVVSIFVNPLQFGVNEDFAAYPRTLDADCELLRQAGVDIVFAPAVKDMYPAVNTQGLQQSVLVQPPPLADGLCGAARPGHFAGVATVVAKLFNIVAPHLAVFGKKDYQQLLVIRSMVRELNMPVEIVAGETAREATGLALSSRNGYLSASEKQLAPQLAQTLQTIAVSLQQGVRDYAQLTSQARTLLENTGWRVDYIAICDPQDLCEPKPEAHQWVILAAAYLGSTRLIDNLEVNLIASSPCA